MITEETLRRIIREEMCKATCGLGEIELKELSHITGMVSDMGDGDFNRGVEVIREDHKWVIRYRKMTEKIGTTVVLTVTTIVVTALSCAIGIALKLKGGN